MSTFQFGTPATQPTAVPTLGGTGAFGFGAQAAAPASAPNFNFGTPAASVAPTATAAPSFNFGSTATTAAQAAVPTMGFGTPQAGAPTLGFGATQAAAPTLGFGATQAGAPTLGFGATQAGAPTLGFSAAQAATPTGFGSTQVSAPSLGFGATVGASTAPATSTLPTLGGGAFSFANKPASTTTSVGLNFGTSTTSTAAFSGGLFGKPASITTAAPAPTATSFVGLGGIDVSSTQPKDETKKNQVKVKETLVPDEIAKTVDNLKSYIKSQKQLSSEIGRTSTSKLTSVSGEIVNLRWALQEIANSVDSNYNQIKMLRKETTKAQQSLEMAQRTQDTPAGLQFENTAPFEYFQNLVAKYEQDLINFRQQIALTENHMRSLTQPQNVTPEDLKRGFLQINESFISLAGRLHELHQKVESQKEQHLNLRKYRLRDSTNVFAELDNPEVKVDTSKVSSGPTPFSYISTMSSFGKSFANAAAEASVTQRSK